MPKESGITISKYPSSNLVKIDVNEERRKESIWMSEDSYKELVRCIALDINEKVVEHIPQKGNKFK